MNEYFQIRQNGRTAKIYIYGYIQAYAYGDGVSAKRIVDQIKELDVDEIHVHIDSYGGSVSEGWAIYNALRDHPAKIVTHGDGFVASAAMYPFLAGDERVACSLSAYYLHEVSLYSGGYADELRKAADEADLMTDVGIQAFVEAAGMEENEVRKLMKDETWLTPAQVLEHGIATHLEKRVDAGHTQSAWRSILQRLTAPAAPAQEPIKTNIMQTLMGACK